MGFRNDFQYEMMADRSRPFFRLGVVVCPPPSYECVISCSWSSSRIALPPPTQPSPYYYGSLLPCLETPLPAARSIADLLRVPCCPKFLRLFKIGGEKRTLLRFHPRIAPIKVAVFPLVKNKPELMEKARGIYESIRLRYNAFWDVSGAIGEWTTF